MTPIAAYEFVEDVGSNLAFVAKGSTLDEMFSAAAEALLRATVVDPGQVRGRDRRPISDFSGQIDLLLLRFLDTLIYLQNWEALLLRPYRVQVRRDGPYRLQAQMEGEVLDPRRHRLAGSVRSVSLPDLRVVHGAGGWEAAVTLLV